MQSYLLIDTIYTLIHQYQDTCNNINKNGRKTSRLDYALLFTVFVSLLFKLAALFL